ncbi:MAG: preprotein translocase subunit SecE [Spirochaetales bacterium]
MKKIQAFFNEMMAELRKVIWPSPEKVVENTRIVVLSTVALALFFGTVDFLLIVGTNFVF